MKIKFVLLIAFVLLNISGVFAQSNQNNEAAVRQVVESYFDGLKNNNVESMKKAFHQKAEWFTLGSEDISKASQSEIQSNLRRNAQKNLTCAECFVMKIVSVDITRAAAVKVEIEVSSPDKKLQARLPYKSENSAEYLSLIKFSDGWKIVSKILSEKRQEPQTN